jgi:hypothetical protein
MTGATLTFGCEKPWLVLTSLKAAGFPVTDQETAKPGNAGAILTPPNH